MSAKVGPITAVQKEKLMYFLALRQRETLSRDLREAYARLTKKATIADGRDVGTVILNWLEAELGALQRPTGEAGPLGIQLMKVAVGLANTLKQ